jgi:hypothetical protein
MHDDQKGTIVVLGVGMEDVDRLARVLAVGKTELVSAAARAAVSGGIPLPAGNDLRMLGDPGAVVVLRLEVDRAQRSDLFQNVRRGGDAHRSKQESGHVVGEPDSL